VKLLNDVGVAHGEVDGRVRVVSRRQSTASMRAEAEVVDGPDRLEASPHERISIWVPPRAPGADRRQSARREVADGVFE
jgi:hypothetical protein